MLTMSCLQEMGAFSAPLLHDFFISAGPEINILQEKSISCFLHMVSFPEPTVSLVSSFAIPCHSFLLFPLLSGGLEQPPKLSKSPPDDQQLSLLPSQSPRCSSYLKNEVAAFSLSMAVAVEETFGNIYTTPFLLALCKGTKVSLITSCGFWDTVRLREPRKKKIPCSE